jgi:hypothetical protein
MSSTGLPSMQGMSSTALVQLWSVMVRMVAYPHDLGSLVMKSTAMVPNGSECSGVIGYISGLFLCVIGFIDWQVTHLAT